jgi:magnesium-transporting ATPase (P-type)
MNEIIKKNGVSFGVFSGIASVLITSLIYALDINLFTSMLVGFTIIIFYLVLGVYIVSKTKKDLKGIINFKEAFTVYFISAVIGILISTTFNIILFNYIDPSAKETIRELTIKSTVNMMRKFDAPASEVNKAILKIKESDQFSISEALKGSVFSILFSAFFGLILAAIFKTKPAENY